MNRILSLPFMFGLAALSAHGAETTRASPIPAGADSTAVTSSSTSVLAANSPITLAMLEAQPTKPTSDPEYWQTALRLTNQAIGLIESDTLTTADEFFRVSALVCAADNRFRTDRVQYELLLAAAALGNPKAEQGLASAWDQLLAAIGRPLRTDFTGLAQKHAEFFQVDAAPGCIQTVLREPEKARAVAKSAQRNAELKGIVGADQADRREDWSKLTPEERKAVSARDRARNVRTREIIGTGELHTAADFANAALVMQHSAQFSGYQTAHELAVCSMLLGDRGLGRWLIAATYDRMLGSVGHDQRFGTQYSGMNGVESLVGIDTAGICDAERKALGCPTLKEIAARTLNAPSTTEAARLVAEFRGPNRSVRDPKFGLAVTYPDGWHVNEIKRWGDQQTTIFFEITAAPEPSPNLYYRVYHQPRPFTPEALEAFVRDEAEKKEASRRENMPDYTNRADSFRSLKMRGNPAFSWLADFTKSNGDKWAEYFVRIQTDGADASFFLQAPSDQIESLRPAVDQLMNGLKMPAPQN